MDEPERKSPGRRYHLEALRTDGTQTAILRSLTWDEAERAHDAVRDAQIFAEINIVPDELSLLESDTKPGTYVAPNERAMAEWEKRNRKA